MFIETYRASAEGKKKCLINCDRVLFFEPYVSNPSHTYIEMNVDELYLVIVEPFDVIAGKITAAQAQSSNVGNR